MKATITKDEIIVISADTIAEGYAIQYLLEKARDGTEIVMFETNLLENHREPKT